MENTNKIINSDNQINNENFKLDTSSKNESPFLKSHSQKIGKYISKEYHNNFKALKKNIKINDILYLARTKSISTLFYADGTRQNLYETLVYFEKNVLFNEPNFVRINRNYIINLNYISNFKVLRLTKTGELNIGSEIFHISRRILPYFKKKVSKENISFF